MWAAVLKLLVQTQKQTVFIPHWGNSYCTAVQLSAREVNQRRIREKKIFAFNYTQQPPGTTNDQLSSDGCFSSLWKTTFEQWAHDMRNLNRDSCGNTGFGKSLTYVKQFCAASSRSSLCWKLLKDHSGVVRACSLSISLTEIYMLCISIYNFLKYCDPESPGQAFCIAINWYIMF